jgi:2,4-didehydro-3-deoxy-L-rhamnonate hydrolase
VATRIGTLQEGGRGRAVLVDQTGSARILTDVVTGAPDDVRGLIADWPRWREPVLAAGEGRAWRPAEQAEGSWLAPLMPRKLLCVGANYHDHVAEMDAAIGLHTPPAPFPYTFLKPPTALTGSGRSVRHPAYGHQLDWEAELAVVIGDPVAAAGPDPLSAVFGYTILNDLSLRDFVPFPHALGLDAVVSKGFDGAAPMGPWITLADAVPDPGALPISLSVNGEVMQDSSTSQMIFDVQALVAHYARVLTLEPGDVIATGTPAGVGAGRRPPRFLAPGDEIEVRIGNLGILRTPITAPAPGALLPTTTTEVTT